MGMMGGRKMEGPLYICIKDLEYVTGIYVCEIVMVHALHIVLYL